jgi:hypothetical protein
MKHMTASAVGRKEENRSSEIAVIVGNFRTPFRIAPFSLKKSRISIAV